MERGNLYICPTPIGNLKDISPRVLEILGEADLIGAEDTRRTLRLLNHFEIKKPLTSCHEHNEAHKSRILLDAVEEGKTVALVSDAGMPGISDPGHELIKEAIERGIEVTVIPGPTAFVVALVASGLDTSRFAFLGFLPRDTKERKIFLEEVAEYRETLIFYEAPHRLKKTLKGIADILGNRRIALSREISKLHEENKRGTLEEMINFYEENEPRGEYVLVVEGFKGEKTNKEEVTGTPREQVEYLIESGMSKKDAIKDVAKRLGISKNEVYQEVLDL